MAENCEVELIDRPDGNQFIARIWRTTQKDETTTQKANEELIFATQKEESTTPKSIIATPKPLTATQKEIFEYLHKHPAARPISTDCSTRWFQQVVVRFCCAQRVAPSVARIFGPWPYGVGLWCRFSLFRDSLSNALHRAFLVVSSR